VSPGAAKPRVYDDKLGLGVFSEITPRREEGLGKAFVTGVSNRVHDEHIKEPPREAIMNHMRGLFGATGLQKGDVL